MDKKVKDTRHRVVFFIEQDEFLQFKSLLTLKNTTVSDYMRGKIAEYIQLANEDPR